MKIIRPEVRVDIPDSGGIMELMDMTFLPLYNVTAKELDYISGECSDEELDALVNLTSFTSKRKALEIRNKYLKQWEEFSQQPTHTDVS